MDAGGAAPPEGTEARTAAATPVRPVLPVPPGQRAGDAIAAPEPARPPVRRVDPLVVALVGLQVLGVLAVLAGRPGPGILGAILATAALFALAGWRRTGPGRTVGAVLAAGYLCLAAGWALAIGSGAPLRGGTGMGALAWGSLVHLLLVAAAAVLLARRRPRWRAALWWDAAVVTLGSLALAAAVLGWMVGPGGLSNTRVPVGFPVLEVGLVVLLVVLAVPAGPAGALGWLTVGAALVAACDVGWHAAAIRGGLPGLSALELGLTTGYALSAGAALGRQPRAARTRRGGLAAHAREVAPAALFVGLSLLLLLASVLTAQVPRPAGALALSCVVVGLVRFCLAAIRLVDPDAEPPAGRTDDLTGLANRLALAEALSPGSDDVGDGWTLRSQRVGLLLVDLDRFKDVNDALGHHAGDELLTEVGSRLQSVLRANQMLARLGGDEFAVVLPGAGGAAAARVAQQLRVALDEPFEIRGSRLHVQASVGVATGAPAAGEPGDLLRQADVAMYRAKETGAGVEVYEPALDHHSADRLKRIDELRNALQRGDLEVHLQPQVDLHTGAVVGAEALARWRHPQDGVLLPDSFLPLAAQTGLLGPVAALVLDRALEACATWWRPERGVPVSVNLTAHDLRSPGLHDVVADALRRHGLPPGALRIEITEEAMLTDRAATAVLLRRWRLDGVSVAIDDYGTGYSSLAYLRELPVDELKLDRVFVADLDRRTTATIVRHTIAMAHGLRLRVVAEGVEDQATARTMADLGCDVGQGLHFGAAMRPADFVELLERTPGP